MCSGGRLERRLVAFLTLPGRLGIHQRHAPCRGNSRRLIKYRFARAKAVNPRGVLRQSAVAHFAETPQALDHMKDVLAAGTSSRAQSVDAPLVVAQRNLIRATVDPVPDTHLLSILPVRLVPVGLVSKNLSLLAMKELGHLGAV